MGQRLQAFVTAPEGEARAILTDPDGTAHPVAIARRGARGVAEWTDTAKPGLYVLRPPDGSELHFVVRAPGPESDLARLEPAELVTLAASLKAVVVRSPEEYVRLDERRRFGRELWRPLLAGVLLLMLGEIALARWFARRAA